MVTVAEIVAGQQAELMRQWSEGARLIAGSERLGAEELSSVLPAYLVLLGHSDPGGAPCLSGAQQALIERHLSNRLRQGFVLNDILTELAILGRCVGDLLAATPAAERPPVDQVARLFVELQLTAAA